jgi:glutamyl/glutaminyl-tRNA synthetase
MQGDSFQEMKGVLRVCFQEWISSTPKHKILYDSFGWPSPQFAHLPLLLNPDGTKLSKRDNDVSVEYYVVGHFVVALRCIWIFFFCLDVEDSSEIQANFLSYVDRSSRSSERRLLA